MTDMRDMVDAVTADVLGDLGEVPCGCSCGDAVDHGRRVVATHAADVEDARLLMRMLGLVASPPPTHVRRTEYGQRSKAKPTTNH